MGTPRYPDPAEAMPLAYDFGPVSLDWSMLGPSSTGLLRTLGRLHGGDPAGRGLEGDDLLDPGSGDRARADRVHPDAVGPELGRERADQPDDAHLRRGVGGAAVERPLAGHRRDRDQAAVPAFDH